MKRIAGSFAKAKAENRGAFVAFLTIGHPTLEESERAADALIAGGADIIELGVPFSDPFADGGVIRAAACRALENGVSLDDAIALAKRLRARHPETGLVLFSYYNPVFSKGADAFADALADAGIDAALIVDLPLEEREELLPALRAKNVGFVPLIAPNTPIERVKKSAEGIGDGFLYAITVKGTTGERAELPADLAGRLDAIRAAVPVPVAAGFGISTRAQAAEVSRHADGFIVGSAIVRKLDAGESLADGILP
ncbi:MAG: tryptophan synthase subunit alpha [Kiritimatiellae bacterium]|nr:tryptophan synthase subunit alpha [Kiritimatiellia bacterium]